MEKTLQTTFAYEMAKKYFAGLNNLILVNDKDKKLMVYIKKLQSDLAGS